MELEQRTNAELLEKIRVLELEAKAHGKERENTSRMETLLNQTLNRVGELESAMKHGVEKPKHDDRAKQVDGTPRTAAPSDNDDDHDDSSGSEEEPSYIVTPSGQRVPLMPFEKIRMIQSTNIHLINGRL